MPTAKQYIGGYILDNLLPSIEDDDIKKNAQQLANWLSHFDAFSSSDFFYEAITYSPQYSVIINLLQRGLPTRLNYKALQLIVDSSSLIEWDNTEQLIGLKWNNQNSKAEAIFKCLHIIDPRIDRNSAQLQYNQSWEALGSLYEEDFLFRHLPDGFDARFGDFIIQLICTQRELNSIIKEKVLVQNLSDQVRNNFEDQRTDFSIQFPYTKAGEHEGLVIEVDGRQHAFPVQAFLDIERDRAVLNAGWNKTVRVKTTDFNRAFFQATVNEAIYPSLNVQYVQILYQNYKNSLLHSPESVEMLSLVLSPFAIARFQRLLLEAIVFGKLSLSADRWNIAVVERDVPFSFIAFEDFKESISNLNELSEFKIILPPINLDIFSTAEFINSSLHGAAKVLHLTTFDTSIQYDILFDISVLQRSALTRQFNSSANETITIKSAHYIDTKRKIATTSLIKYYPFASKNKEDKWEINTEKEVVLEYFLKSVFRKQKFRTGQLPIMHTALQCKSVIGLLPTGGGKSLTYQLSALLQPGISIVIDPIRSLMKDQVDGLNKNLIDSCVFINSTQKGEVKRQAMHKMAKAESLFVFISPERLQMEEFRTLLQTMYANENYFSYCIVDEAHCVSEWGHDFRTAYLKLGQNAIKFCKTANLDTLPLFGLTATASYDVLADVQRELSGNDESIRLNEDAIVRAEYTKRDELQFVIEHVTYSTNVFGNIWDLKKEISSQKQKRALRLLQDIPASIEAMMLNPKLIYTDEEFAKTETKNIYNKIKIENFKPSSFYDDAYGALFFCPHTKGGNGVTDKFKISKDGALPIKNGYFDILSETPGIKAGFFMGSGNDEITALSIQEESFQNQDDFLNKKLNLMVATKAFGMGIDKENIRYTVHVNYPGSIESFVQEAGRAGRDKKLALSYILFNDETFQVDGEDIDHDHDVNMFFHKNSFKGVSKELAILEELLTEIFFPDRMFELEGRINDELGVDVKLKYWEGGANKRIYINKSFTEPLGYLNLSDMNGAMAGSVDEQLSHRIFNILGVFIHSLNLEVPIHEWLQTSNTAIGIQSLLESLNVGERFNLTIGFFNNISERVKIISIWLRTVIHPAFTENKVKTMRSSCPDATAFIEEIVDFYQHTTGINLEFKEFCDSRDSNKGNPIGTAYSSFFSLYNGYRDKQDTEKAVYRLSTLGIIDDYTVNFSSNTFTLYGTKKADKKYSEALKIYLLKYYSEKSTANKLKSLKYIEEKSVIKKTLSFLVRFVYKEIQKKRHLAINDMRSACRLGLDKGNIELKTYIDLYFNSKYARSGYSYVNESDTDVNASLPDITDNGKNSKIKWVWDFMEIVDEDPKAGQIDNIKHLRGACTRMLSNQPDNYTFLLLNSFTLYMLEYKSQRFLEEAEALLQQGFISIMEIEPNITDDKLEALFAEFIKKLTDKNIELTAYMKKYGFSFDFHFIEIKRAIKPLKHITNTLSSLNKILN